MTKTTIEAISYYEGEDIVTSLELEAELSEAMQRLGVPSGRIEELTGIKERHFFKPGTKPSEASTVAAQKLFDTYGFDKNKLGVIINCSVSRDYMEPSTACLVHGNLGLSPMTANFDITNACLGFINGMNIAQLMIEAGQIDYALLVGAETVRDGMYATIERLKKPTSDMLYFFNQFASLTLGSGAVAMLLAREDLSKTGHIINKSVTMAATEHNRLCIAPNMKEMQTDAQGLLRAGIELAGKTWKLAEQKIENWSIETIDAYVPHQISVRHVNKFSEQLGIPKEKIHQNLFNYGNVGPVGLPTALGMAVEKGDIKEGDHVALTGIGSGINCTMMSVSW